MIKYKKLAILLILIIAICMILPIASASDDANIIYVSPDGSDDGDGSISNPYYNITRAMNDVNEDKNTIVLENGTYVQSNINLDKSVTIIGQGDVVLDGNQSIIIKINKREVNVNLINLTFINAYATGFGSAIINNATLTVDSVKFINNTARASPAIDNSADLFVNNSYFEGNEAYGRDAGALSNMGNAVIMNTVFVNNTAYRNGGAIKHQGTSLKVINSTFIENDAYGSDNYGGAIYIWASKAEIINSTFNNNYGGYGGAVFIGGGNGESTALNVSGCIFESNKALTAKAIDVEEGYVNVSYSKIIDDIYIFKAKSAVLDYNWWGSNSPNWEGLLDYPKPKVYAVLKITNSGNDVKAGVYWVNTSDVAYDIPDLVGNISINSTFIGCFNFSKEYKLSVPENSNVTVCLDKEQVSLIVGLKIKTQVIANDIEMYYKGNTRFEVFLKDINGNAISNQSVIIRINGVNYTRITDKNGGASIGIGLNSGKYVVRVYYIAQLEDYLSSNATAMVNVLPTVEGNDLVKVFRNATQYAATFKDSKGNYLAKGNEVQFNVNGVMYKRTTDEKGTAQLDINLPQGNYIITAMNLVTGENCANNITVISRIVNNNDLTKYYRNGSQYVVTLLGDDGNPVGAGEEVTFNINGIFYKRTTNASGQAQLNINLPPGDYIITAEYKQCRVSNNIKVLPVIFANDLVMSYMDGSKFQAKLIDGQGKPLSGENVTFNINGVIYNRLTDIDGTAYLNIELMAGEYIITSTYNRLNIANQITIL